MSEKLVVQDEQSLNELIERVREAQKKYATYSQEQVDKIFRAGYLSSRKDSAGASKAQQKKIRKKLDNSPIYHF